MPPSVATSSTFVLPSGQPPLNSAKADSTKADSTKAEQKQDSQASSSGLGSSPSQSVALTLRGQEVDLSYMYDGLTIYPKSTGEITGLESCIEKCKQLEFMKANLGPLALFLNVDSPRTSTRTKKATNCVTQITQKGRGGAQFSRYIHRDEDDHDLYHQDSFVIDRSHFHLKFNRAITEDQFSQMVFIFAAESLITGEQASAYIRAFSQRNREARAALDAVCVSGDELASPQDKKQQNKQAIIKFISNCRSNDILIDLHEYLLDPKFDYLREITEMHSSKEWQGTDRTGAVVKTSKAWAQLEKGISLQMIKNIKDRASKFTPALGTERSKQLADSHGFFGIKRTRSIASPHAPRTYKTLNAFSRADEDKLDRKYNKIFRPS